MIWDARILGENGCLQRGGGHMSAILALQLVVAKPLVSYFSTKENYLIFSFSPLLQTFGGIHVSRIFNSANVIGLLGLAVLGRCWCEGLCVTSPPARCVTVNVTSSPGVSLCVTSPLPLVCHCVLLYGLALVGCPWSPETGN